MGKSKMTDCMSIMKQVKVKDVSENFEQIFDDLLESGEPVEFLKETGNAILVSEEVWCGMKATLHLLSIPSMRGSIRCEMRKAIANTKTGLD